MGWQTLSASLRRWDTGNPSREVEAAVEEVLAHGDDEEALKIFTEALDPSLQCGTDFLRRLAKTEGAKCRCDAVWYGDTIAYGCKTCGLSSASCICVFCFDAGDHEGHDFYISRSDYGCCDCGDTYAWRRSGFCRHHPGPRKEVDPAQLLPEATRVRAQLLIPAQVRRLVGFQQSSRDNSSARPAATSEVAPSEQHEPQMEHTVHEGGTAEAASTTAIPDEAGTNNNGVVPMVPVPEAARVLVTGVNLRVSEEQLREFFAGRLATASTGAVDEVPIFSVELVRDADTKASRGRAYLTVYGKDALDAAAQANGEILRGSPLKIHTGAEGIAAAERHIRAWETHFEWLLSLGGFHDGLRKIIGQVFLEPTLLGDLSAVEVLLKHSHLMEPSVRKLETNLMVDLMLDLDFKFRFAQVFTKLYPQLVLARAGNQDTNELGDFTCQIFTRHDVTLELVREHDLVRNLLGCLWDLLQPALASGSDPAVFNHESTIFRDHEIIQCSMDLLYVLDHTEVAREIIRTPKLRGELWEGWVRILLAMQAMNPHVRRSDTHVEFTNAAWGNALTLHTDLMSNTWLILDAVESKADLEAMARWAWTALRAWMLRVHAAEQRSVKDATERTIQHKVSDRNASFHAPVNRVLALLLHHLCVRGAVDEMSPGQEQSVRAAFETVGLTSEADVLWWMEHPLRALALHAQVSAGMWRRNGEALENESEFYRMNYWHHLLIDMDLLIMRLATILLRPETFFRTVLTRFELPSLMQPGDPFAALAPGSNTDDEFVLPRLQSFCLLLYQLLGAHSPLSLNFKQMVTHTTRQYLGIGPRSHSQLWDPRLERSTATATATDQQMLERSLREISVFSEADGSGHNPAKYHLKDDQWTGVDPYFHLFSWSEQQKAEENISAALKAKNETLLTWLNEVAKLRPQPLQVYSDGFYAFAACGLVQAFCWLLLTKFAFRHLKENGAVADGRLLVLALHLALRSLQAPLDSNANAESAENAAEQTNAILMMEDTAHLFALAPAMAPHLLTSARKRFRVTTLEYFDEKLLANHTGAPAETDLTLLDAVERLCLTPEGTVSGALARGLRARLLQDQNNIHALEAQPRPWFAPPPISSSTRSLSVNSEIVGGNGGPPGRHEGQSDVNHGGQQQDEARQAKRRRAAQERQQRMLDDLKKRQAAFITGAQGQRMLEEAKGSSGPADGTGPAECVVCMAQQEGEDGDNPLGLLCFMRPAPASCLPRPRVPSDSAVLLQVPRVPVADSQGRRGPQCFSPNSPDGLVMARSCSHRMHFTCWRRFRPAAIASGGGRLTCPYCGTAANALLPAAAPSEASSASLPLSRVLPGAACTAAVASTASAIPHPATSKTHHGDASADFAEQLALHLQKLGDEFSLPSSLGEALALGDSGPAFLALAKLAADNVALSEVRLRARFPTSSCGQGRSPDSTSAMSVTLLQCVIKEAQRAAPEELAERLLGSRDTWEGLISKTVREASPHGRFQTLVALLLGLSNGAARADQVHLGQVIVDLLVGFYFVEVVLVLGALACEDFVETQLQAAEAAGARVSSALWRVVRDIPFHSQPEVTRLDAMPPGRICMTPIKSRGEALKVLSLSLNLFLAKVHLVLSLLDPDHEVPFQALGQLGTSPDTLQEHRLLARMDLGLPNIEDLLSNCAEIMSAPALANAPQVLQKWLGHEPILRPLRGQQPSSGVLLVLVSDDEEAVPISGEAELPPHVWRVSPSGWDRLLTAVGGISHMVELSHFPGMHGRLFCVTFRVNLPVITGTVYQKFYTQFVHARCTICRSSPPIPTLCLLCGTFLCCNSECCRRRGSGDLGNMLGEVTQHAQTCGFGTCFFLQLSNSLVHIVADGFIACWGSLYLDGHGEEEYNLARPLHISEARLQQLTTSLREVSFDFESRLKWKKVIFV